MDFCEFKASLVYRASEENTGKPCLDTPQKNANISTPLTDLMYSTTLLTVRTVNKRLSNFQMHLDKLMPLPIE